LLILADLQSAAAIDYLFELRRAHSGIGICYTYFTYDGRQKQDGPLVAASLLRQLVSQLKTLPDDLYHMYDEDKRGNPPNDSAVMDLLISCVDEFTSIYVFLDGLDECTDKQQVDIIEIVRRLCNSGARVLLTSQPQLQHLVEEIKPAVWRAIMASEEDLRTYIDQRLVGRYSNLKEPLLKSVMVGADGM
jgi:hypothetical protein